MPERRRAGGRRRDAPQHQLRIAVVALLQQGRSCEGSAIRRVAPCDPAAGFPALCSMQSERLSSAAVPPSAALRFTMVQASTTLGPFVRSEGPEAGMDGGISQIPFGF